MTVNDYMQWYFLTALTASALYIGFGYRRGSDKERRRG